jgi:Flp pilus assembly protein CpaB
MSALRPVILGLGVAAIAAFGTDYLLQRRARANGAGTTPSARPAAAAAANPQAASTPKAGAPAPAIEPATARGGAQLAVGQRAVSVPLRDGAVDDLLQPGAHVDVLATLDVQEAGARRSVTRVIAERVVVLAVQGRDGERAGRRASVSLAVAPDAANAIELAAAKGTIGFAVRAPQDEANGKAAAATLVGLAGEAAATAATPTAAPTPAAAEASPKWEIQVIRGGIAVRESVDSK